MNANLLLPFVYMKKINLLMLFTLIPFGLNGCSIYHAAHSPSPVEYKEIKLGDKRADIISKLGYPKMTDTKNDQKTDTFEFYDGYHSATKSRMILYLAGDLITVGLAELIFWPLEENVFDGKQCKGLITYDRNDTVITYDVKDNDGDSLLSSSVNNTDD
jgi:hypothetical protein